MNKFCLIFLLSVCCYKISISQTTIQMKREGGVSIVPCKVNGLSLSFIFDTGASDVTISLTEALFMLKNGYLSKSDIVGTANYSNANGEISEGYVINLKEIEFAGLKLYNVSASIVKNMDAPLLLGQSAISKLGKIQLDLNANTITIIKENDFTKPTPVYTNTAKTNTTIPKYISGAVATLSDTQLKNNIIYFYSKNITVTDDYTDYSFSFNGNNFIVTNKYRTQKHIESIDVKYLTKLSTNDYTMYLGTGRGIECNCVVQYVDAEEGTLFTNFYTLRKNGSLVFTNNGELINKVPDEQLYYGTNSLSGFTLKPSFKKDYRKFKATLIELAKRNGNKTIKFDELGNL